MTDAEKIAETNRVARSMAASLADVLSELWWSGVEVDVVVKIPAPPPPGVLPKAP